MGSIRNGFLSIALLLAATPAAAQDAAHVADVSLRLSGKEVQLSAASRGRIAALAHEIVARCGPNTMAHAPNFGPQALETDARLTRQLQASRVRVVFSKPFESRSLLGGTLPVSEAVIGLEDAKLFVGPTFTRHGPALAEHLQCEYLASLELACLPELEAHLPAHYGAACKRFERDAAGRIVMPPPDIAPSCS